MMAAPTNTPAPAARPDPPASRPRDRATLAACTRGVAYVEFLVAFPALFLAFAGTWELTQLWSAKLIVDHAAFAAARAAAVVIPQPDAYGVVRNALDPTSTATIEAAANIALAPAYLRGWIAGDFALTFPAAPGGAGTKTTFVPEGDPGPPGGAPSMVNTRLEVAFVCHLPPADYFICGTAGSRPLVGEASFPYQGAYYDYVAGGP